MTALQSPMARLRVLVVDDEALARTRLRSLLGDCSQPLAQVDGEAAGAVKAMELMQRNPFDVVLLDIHMPGVGGLELARALADLPDPPAVVFVTAFAEHAVQAFELEAVDYLTKPVRLERLQVALQKALRFLQERARSNAQNASEEVLIIQDRNRTERIALHDVVYFKAELKYITVRTSGRSYIMDGSLNDLEDKYGARFMRIHRNALIARRAVRSLEKQHDPAESDCWAVRLHGVDELMLVSRRQLTAVRDLVATHG